MVLPVPESPANSAVTPCPRPPPGRIRHSLSTWSRCRARAASSRSCAGDGVGEHEVGPADARLDRGGPGVRARRRSAPGRPAAAGRRSTGRSSSVAASCAQRTARPIWPGPEVQVRRGARRPGRAERGRSTAVRGRPGRAAAPRPAAGPRGSSRVPADVAGEQHRHAAATRACAGRPRPRRSGPRPGSATIPHPRSSASRPATPDQFLRGRAGRQPAQVEPERRRSPAAASAAAAAAAPVRRPWSRR